MVNVPSVPEIITVNSETLQTQIRDLLPSQNGFGSELQATNVITPIIDLTAAAEGSGLPSYLQTALAYGSQTSFNVSNTTTTLVNSTGFYRVFGTASGFTNTPANEAEFILTDGVTPKVVWSINSTSAPSAPAPGPFAPFDFTIFLAAGQSLQGKTDSANFFLGGSTRQVATGDGTLVNPNGFPL